jgi:mono/diheme cytochrome c family protein
MTPPSPSSSSSESDPVGEGEDVPALAGGEDDAAMAVIAHGLLNSVSAIQMGAYALKESWEQLSEEQRLQILDIVADQAGHVRGILQDMIRGLPTEVIRALNGLERHDEDS